MKSDLQSNFKNMGVRIPLCVLGSILLVCLATAALGRQIPAASEQPSVQVTTRLVEVNVIARNKQGQPATDLSRDDFVLLDENRPQPLGFFAKEVSEPLGSSPQKLSAGTFSNRLEQFAGSPTTATVILFDGLNTPLVDQAYARQQIMKFLEQLPPQQPVAICVLGRGLRMLQDFTGDPQLLLRAMAGYTGEVSPGAEPEPEEGVHAGLHDFTMWLDELKLNLINYYARDRALRTVRTLVAISNHVERIPGRKNLIWVAGSFPFWLGRDTVSIPARLPHDPSSFAPEIERTVRALDEANLAVYPVDARGLIAPPDYSPDRGRISREPTGPDHSTFDAMQALAKRTGGHAFYNNNDLRGALHRVLEDSSMTYVLGYYPTHNEWNGNFRRIKIRVRKPGIRLEYRQGYFALPGEPSDPWYRQGVLGAAMWSPLDATRVGLTIHARLAARDLLELAFQIDPRDITLRPKENLEEGTLDLLMVQFSPDDKLLNSTSQVVALRLDQATYERAAQSNALILNERLKLAQGASLVRVLVRDIPSATLGSVSIPLSQVMREGFTSPP